MTQRSGLPLSAPNEPFLESRVLAGDHNRQNQRNGFHEQVPRPRMRFGIHPRCGQPARTPRKCALTTNRFVQITGSRTTCLACPVSPGRTPGTHRHPHTHRGPATASPPLIGLIRMTRGEWDVWTRGSAIRGEPPEDALAALRDTLEDEEPLGRQHAAWALKRRIAASRADPPK